MDKEIEELEKQRIAYLEVDDNRTAGRIEAKIKKLKQDLELKELKGIKAKLNQYIKFIKYKGMQKEFEDHCMSEFVLSCLDKEMK